MTPERVDQISDCLDAIAPEWQDGESFDLCDHSRAMMKAGHQGIIVVEGTWRDAKFIELQTVGNIYGLTFRHNGDYCWFDKKTDSDDKPVA